MLESRRLRPIWLASSFVLALLGAESVARAGALQIRDEAHILSSGDVSRLRSDVEQAPFDARVVTTTAYPDSQELGRYLHRFVSEPDMIIVGLDPEHHHVQVRFGTGSQVSESAWGQIEQSGNDEFRRQDWERGLAAIFRSATNFVSTPSSALPGQRAAPSAGPGMVFLVLGGFIALALLASFFFRRRDLGPSDPYGSPYGSGDGSPPFGGYGYGPQAPGGIGRGMGPLGGGLIGAGLGGLAGYELGKLEGERERLGGAGGDLGSADVGGDPSDNYDGGGGGSDWGGGSDGGGFDGGGGGSDF